MPKSDLPIVISGAGPAGSSLAIRLREQNLPVVLIERYKFPRQKLCGEFISPECLAHFAELGVRDEMLAAGGDRVFETRFFEPGGRSVNVPTNWFGAGDFALSLSRARMDEILLDAARRCGADVFEETSVTGLIVESETVRGVRIRRSDGTTAEIRASITVDATGRARVLTKLADKHAGKTSEQRRQFVGFKAHLTGVDLPVGVCEIYAFEGGYAGLSFVEGDEANLCFLARSSLLGDGGNADAIVDDLRRQNMRARDTLKNAQKVHDWLAVSVPAFGIEKQPAIRGLYTVGDSAAFIDPFTGSGMLMAIESAALLSECISETGVENEKLSRLYPARYRERFGRRLRVSGLLRRVAYRTSLGSAAVRLLSLSDRLCHAVARRTRSAGHTATF